MPRPLRVFLCHASQDKPAVRELYNALNAEGWIDPWLDKAKILPGQDWELVIEKAVDASDVVIVCLSGQSVTKEGFVQREIRYAYDIALEKPEETIFLIPLRLDDCNVPRKLRILHWVDYFGMDKENTYSDLLEALKLRYDQKMRLEVQETERRQIEEKEKHKTDEVVYKFADGQATREKEAWEAKEKVNVIARAKLEREDAQKKLLEFREKEKAEREAKRKKLQEYINWISSRIFSNSRRFGIGGTILLILIFSGFGLNYLINNPPVSFPKATATPKPPTLTSVSFTSTSLPTKTPIPTSILAIGSTMISEKDDMVLVYVPAGEFIMGSDNSNQPDENPEHRVELDAFWIDQTEVTNSEYALCVFTGECSKPLETTNYQDLNYANHPVVFVSWNDANRYCSWAGRRLPTEAEWEKAARGPTGNIYPWSNAAPRDILVNYNNYLGTTSDVNAHPYGVSEYRAADMAGNVWEWVSSLYQTYPYDMSDGRENLTSSGQRVLRGGSWKDDIVRSMYRFRLDPWVASSNIGFRCARTP